MIFVVAPTYELAQDWAMRKGLRKHDIRYVPERMILETFRGRRQPRVQVLDWSTPTGPQRKKAFSQRYDMCCSRCLDNELRRIDARVYVEHSRRPPMPPPAPNASSYAIVGNHGRVSVSEVALDLRATVHEPLHDTLADLQAAFADDLLRKTTLATKLVDLDEKAIKVMMGDLIDVDGFSTYKPLANPSGDQLPLSPF